MTSNEDGADAANVLEGGPEVAGDVQPGASLSANEGAAPAVCDPDGKPLDHRQALLKSGWFQGAVLPADLVSQVRMFPGADVPPSAADGGDGPWCIVVTQDCDLVCGDCLADPVAEVVVATPIAVPSVQCERLRNPREVHVSLTREDGTAQPVSIEIRNRGTLDRILLLTAGPANGLSAAGPAVRLIAGFIARRYIRTPRPEEFDRRFSKARKKLIQLLDAKRDILLDIMLGIEPRREAESGERYTVSLYPILQDQFVEDVLLPAQQPDRRAIREAIRQAMIPCAKEGIDVDRIEVKTRYDISLREYDDMLPMDLGTP